MGRADPTNVIAADVAGGVSTDVIVKFNGFMTPYDQNPVLYSGDTDALMPGYPTACPAPPCGQSLSETSFNLATKAVTAVKTVTVSVQGPTETKHATFNILPTS
jgi:hypothetical protein